MKEIRLDYSNETVNAFLLARFDIVKGNEKRKSIFSFLLKHDSFVRRHFCLVFIPWKYKEKEIVLLETDNFSFGDSLPEGVLQVEKFTSPFEKETPYYSELNIENFVGYEFILENKTFISDVNEGYCSSPLEIFYENFPQLVDMGAD